ncbi:hypothetical protein [Aquibacillus albus]|uniref:Uncharacterized protein n=1 Tax=Aquibacillus albus TaxID=1168171 RepID=A0ABS2N0A1_9BACI|nr:hypothetical protein [Aquibacillus albus]MBM7571580.1 hypothetical protein [Aquibacillus albus]
MEWIIALNQLDNRDILVIPQQGQAYWGITFNLFQKKPLTSTKLNDIIIYVAARWRKQILKI